jgi:hypothetical protein
MLGGFPDGVAWYNKGANKHAAGTFSPSQMADVMFGRCPENDICVSRPTLHGGASNEETEPAALRDPEFHQALKPLASSTGTQGWSIALAPTLQHFYPPEGGVSLYFIYFCFVFAYGVDNRAYLQHTDLFI